MSPLTFPDIDPILLSLGPLHIRWYGLMYILGFAASYFLVLRQINSLGYQQLKDHFENINFILILCVVLGGRLGYVLFYNFSYYLNHPLEIPATWSGGMSFHGACIGLILGGFIYCRRNKINFWKAADIYAVTIPIGLGLGRIGNFINGELFGRVSDVPWAMVFPYGGSLPRHPSQLYEALLEGAVLFCILWTLRKKPYRQNSPWPHGSLMALFIILYGFFRIIVEFFREPDAHIGFIAGMVSMGQLLSLVMIGGGTLLFVVRKRQQKSL